MCSESSSEDPEGIGLSGVNEQSKSALTSSKALVEKAKSNCFKSAAESVVKSDAA